MQSLAQCPELHFLLVERAGIFKEQTPRFHIWSHGVCLWRRVSRKETIHKGRWILLNIKKGAVPGPGSAEQGRVGLNRMCNDPVTRKDREGGAWGRGAVPAETGTPARVPGKDWGLPFSLPASGVQFQLLPSFPGRCTVSP